MFPENILEVAWMFYEEYQLVTEYNNITPAEPMNIDTLSKILQASKTFDNVYANSVILKGEL